MTQARAACLLALSAMTAILPLACEGGRGDAPEATTHAAITPAVGETEAWIPQTFYQAATYTSLIYDEARKELVSVGGSRPTGGDQSATWTWSQNGDVQLRTPKTSPPGRSEASIAYDSDRKLVVLFGGTTGADRDAETWTWDGQDWTNVQTATRPPPRAQASMTYDPVRKLVVMTGGYRNGLFHDTWTFDGKTWTDETAGKSQLATAFGSTMMFFDGKEKVPAEVVALGAGACTTVSIWRYRASGWVRESELGSGPTVCPTAAGFDAKRNQVLLFGLELLGTVATVNKVWAYDAGWTELPSSTPPIAGRYLIDGATFGGGELFINGGQNPWGGRISAMQHWDGTTWKTESHNPGYRLYPAVTQAKNGALFLFGGIGDGSPRDTWLFDGKSWNMQNTPNPPPGRGRAVAAFDEKRSEVLLYGGVTEIGTPRRDTWTWNGTTWSQESPSTTPGDVFQGGGLVYDPVRDRSWLLDSFAGGTSNARLWAWSGQSRQWSPVTTGPGPLASTYPSFAFDRVRNVAVLFGGTFRDDTWTWDGATWTRLAPKNRPAGRQGAAFTWDPRHERLVLFGGYGAGNVALNDVWTWDGQDWTSLVSSNTKVPPKERGFPTLSAFDGSGNMLAFGGDSNEGPRIDAWLFRTRGNACTSGNTCPSGFCVDDVCCEAASCGSCETCAGTDRGVCSKVRNAEDADSCSAKAGKRCDENGACVGGVSASCSKNSECASGFCVDGVCCSTSCDLPCEACAAARKASGSDDGRCGAAKIGENPGGRCAAGASCNASGSCETRTRAVCRDELTLDLGQGQLQACAPYRCTNDACTRSCKTYRDCAFPATCSPAGRCESRETVVDASGCGVGARSGTAAFPLSILFGLALAGRRRRQRRATKRTTFP